MRPVLAGALVLALAVPASLWAHARLLSSDPPAGAMLEASPREIRLVFSERPELALALVRVVSGADTVVLSRVTRDAADPNVVVASLGSPLSAGQYRILWRVAARDGHPIRGELAFSVSDPASAAAPATSLAPPLAVPAPSPGMTDIAMPAIGGAVASILTRWLGFASLFALIGAVVFRFTVLRQYRVTADDSFVHIAATNAATLGLASSVGVILASALKLARESSDMPDVAMSSMMLGSSWGFVVSVQILLAVAAAAAFRFAHSASDSSRATAWNAALAAALLLGVTPALGGHAAAGDRAYLAIPADIVHVLAGSAWLGTLVVIVIVGIPAALKTPDAVRPGARVAGMINAFSPVALISGGAVVATGIGSTVIRLPAVEALWTTPYGAVLGIKVLFVVMLFGAGAWNWRRMKPRLTSDEAVSPLRSSATFELVIAAAVLALTAILVALETP